MYRFSNTIRGQRALEINYSTNIQYGAHQVWLAYIYAKRFLCSLAYLIYYGPGKGRCYIYALCMTELQPSWPTAVIHAGLNYALGL